jgi:hypothetical protein
MVDTPDYSTWFTKAAAADAIGVSTKTLERWADAGRLQRATWRRQQGPDVVVYHPAEVRELAAKRQPGASAFVLPPASSNGHEPRELVPADDAGPVSPGDLVARAIVSHAPTADAVARALLAGVLSQTSQTSVWWPLLLTVTEAVRYSGLPRRDLLQWIRDGKVRPVSGRSSRSFRIRRRDLKRACEGD